MSPRNVYFKLIRSPQYSQSHQTMEKKLYLTPFNYSKGFSFFYQTSQYHFTIPNKTFYGEPLRMNRDNFTYSFYTKDSAISSNYTATVDIQNVNDPTEITFDYSGNNGISVTVPSTSDLIYNGVTVKGFKITDRDYGVSPVRVEIKTPSTSMIQLNQQVSGKLDFNSQKYCSSNPNYWNCMGNAQTSNNHFIFITTPQILQDALNGMIYRSSDTLSNITVTIYDGVVSYKTSCYYSYGIKCKYYLGRSMLFRPIIRF